MPRYYFNIYDRESHWDDQGYEFPDLAGARDAALRVCAEVVRNLQSDCTGEEWRLEVTDDAGEPLLTLRFVAIEHERPEHEAPPSQAAPFQAVATSE